MGKALYKDPWLRAAALMFASMAALYAIPGMPRDQLAWISDRVASPALLVLTIAALLKGIGQVRHWEEHRFAILMAVAFAFWLEERVFNLSWHTHLQSTGFTDALYLAYYLAAALACELRPHQQSGWSNQGRGVKWQFLGSVAFSVTLFIYFAVVPRVVDAADEPTRVPSLLMYIWLDLWLITRFTLVAVQCRESPRWRAVYWLLAATNLVILAGDSLGYSAAMRRQELWPGAPLDLLGYLPMVLATAVGRLRHLTAEPDVQGGSPDRQPATPGIVNALFLYALSLPIIHFLTTNATNALDASSLGVRRVLVGVYMMASVVVILYYQRLLEARQRTLQDDMAQMNEQLQQSRRMESLGRMAGGVAHDFNNLLMVIHGYSQMLRDALGEKSPLGRPAQEIQKAADRASSLTQQLLAFSRKQVLQPRIFDLNRSVWEVSKMLRRLIGEHILLEVVPCAEPAWVKADPSQFDQVIVNLTLNARDAMPDGGRLTIALEMAEVGEMFAQRFPDMEPGRYVRVTVKDTGVGMDPQTRLRIFEPFFTTKQRGRGTGLGLASVYGIVQQSNGVIDVESSPGQGTSFLIYLPFVARSAQLLDTVDTGPAPSRGWETILVVEDEAPLRSLAVQFLRAQGYAVLEAAAAEQALECAGQHTGPIHLLLTDVVMPGMSGIELAERMAHARPETKVILMSGYIDDLASLENAPVNGAGFLQKPFALSDLATKARRVLDLKT